MLEWNNQPPKHPGFPTGVRQHQDLRGKYTKNTLNPLTFCHKKNTTLPSPGKQSQAAAPSSPAPRSVKRSSVWRPHLTIQKSAGISPYCSPDWRTCWQMTKWMTSWQDSADWHKMLLKSSTAWSICCLTVIVIQILFPRCLSLLPLYHLGNHSL